MSQNQNQPPYWGELPPPSGVPNRRNSRRNSGNRNTLPNDPELRGIYDPAPEQERWKPNRMSQQSATTASTQSPFVSPIDQNFPREGLAPRPNGARGGGAPQQAYNAEAEARRRDRAARNRRSGPPTQEDYAANAGLAGLPGAFPGDSNGFGHKRRPSVGDGNGVSPSTRGPEEYYRSNNGDRYQPQRQPLNVNTDLSRSNTRTEGDRGIRQGSVGARRDPDIIVSGESSRRPSGASAKVRNASLVTSEKSPLQNLEISLKEEKRARAQEAERLARERRAAAESGNLQAPLPTVPPRPRPAQEREEPEETGKAVRFRKRPVTIGKIEQPTEPLPAGNDFASRDRQRQDQPGSVPEREILEAQPSRRLTKEPPPPARNFRPDDELPPPSPHNVPKPGAPRRSNSFRERAANLLAGGAAGAAAAVGIGRRDSNKLKKNPPGDPWRLAREDFDDQTRAQMEAKAMADEKKRQRQALYYGGGPLGSSPTDATLRQQQEAGMDGQGRHRRTDTLASEDHPYEIEESMRGMPKRTNSAKKAEQLLGAGYGSTQLDNNPPFPLPKKDPIRRAITPQEQQLYADRLDRSEELGPDWGNEPGQRGDYTMTGANNRPALGRPGSKGKEGHHYLSRIMSAGRRETYTPGAGLYKPSIYGDEWRTAGTASLTGRLIDLDPETLDAKISSEHEADLDKAWWEAGNKGKRKPTVKTKTDMMDGSHDTGTVMPTVFNPPLFLKCGPLLRYTGIRKEAVTARPGSAKSSKEIWRGSVMIVTDDKKSKYETAPILKLFVAPKTLLPPPPLHVDDATGELADEYIDPLAGHPKVGRDGRTLYVRPVEDLPEEKDLSTIETDLGIYERVPSSTSTQHTRNSQPTGEALGKAVSVKGFRLHAERGHTFWRFNIEVELLPVQQRIGYRINNGPTTAFFVPAANTPMNIMSYSCNGFSLSVDSDEFSGPDPLWRDVLNVHQTRPFHVMVGGGDQVYNDCVMRSTSIFAEWLTIKNPLHKHNAPFTPEMQDELEDFYLTRYAGWFSQGLFSLAGSTIPMVNIWDDHDIIDGFGSYPHHFMASPVFTGLGAIAYKYYLLFQHQSIPAETEASEPSWLLGVEPGPYIQQKSRSVFMDFGGGVKFLGLDCRTERSRDEILSEATYDAILDRLYAEINKSDTTHLLVLMGVPIAYPRLVWLENILTSRIMDPVKALSRAGAFGNLLNQFDGGVEILDDLDDHWTAKNHKSERRFLIQDLQDLAASKSVRISILSGDVHLGAVGQFYTNPKASSKASGVNKPLTKDKDFRYMPNIVTSAIVNTPPPPLLADMLAKRDKVHHLDEHTDESMIPLFGTDVDGKKRNNKVLLPRRNWCSIRLYDPEFSPPPSPVCETPPTGFGGLVRRLSQSRKQGNAFDGPPDSRTTSIDGSRPSLLSRPSQRRTDSFGPRPPISGGGMGLLRRLSSSRGRLPTAKSYMDQEFPETYDSQAPAPPQRTSRARSRSLDFNPASLFRRLSMSRTRSKQKKKPDSGGINGYGAESTEESLPYRQSRDDERYHRSNLGYDGEENYYESAPSPEVKRSRAQQGVGLRGGAVESPPAIRTQRQHQQYGSDGAEYFSPADVGRSTATSRDKGKGKAVEGIPERISQARGYRRESARDEELYSDDEDLTPPGTARGPPVPPKVALNQPQAQPQQAVGVGRQVSRTSTLPPSLPSLHSKSASRSGPLNNPQLQRSDTSKSFQRTPTGLARQNSGFGAGMFGFGMGKQKKVEEMVDLEGGLEIVINVEVNRKDPAGITVPYRLLVPRLFYEDEPELVSQSQQMSQGDGVYEDGVFDAPQQGAGGGGLDGVGEQEGRGRLVKKPLPAPPSGQAQPQQGFLKRLLSLGGGARRRRRDDDSMSGSERSERSVDSLDQRYRNEPDMGAGNGRDARDGRDGRDMRDVRDGRGDKVNKGGVGKGRKARKSWEWDSRDERAYQTGVERGHEEEKEEVFERGSAAKQRRAENFYD